MKTLLTIIICFILTANIFSVNAMKSNEGQTNRASYPSGHGWLEERDGVKILHLSGTNYEMGYQHGSLLKAEVQENMRAWLHFSWISFENLTSMWNVMEEYVPQEYLDEMQGLADGAEITFEEIAAANMVILVCDIGGCFGISAWGNATKDGRLYHARSFDMDLDICDPITGICVQENSVLIVRHPENGYASLIPTVAGAMHGGGGINEQGIAVGQQICQSRNWDLHGTPAQFRVQQVLDHASTAQEAIQFLTANREFGWNFIVSDSKIPEGYIVETTANSTYVGAFDDPTESKKPFWPIQDVVRRTNFFIDPSMARTQRDRYNPGGLIGFIKLLRRTDVYYAVWRSYKVCSEGIEKNWGSLDLNSTMTMLRSCYRGDTDVLLRLIVYLANGTSFNRAFNMWVADPESGDMVVCFATKENIAFNNPVHFFNFSELLNTPPP
jgi:hypothetical protein